MSALCNLPIPTVEGSPASNHLQATAGQIKVPRRTGNSHLPEAHKRQVPVCRPPSGETSFPCPIKVTGTLHSAPRGIKKRSVEPDSPQSMVTGSAGKRRGQLYLKALRPSYRDGTPVTVAPNPARQRLVASISFEIAILSTMLCCEDSPAQIHIRCPILLEEGISTLPCTAEGLS